MKPGAVSAGVACNSTAVLVTCKCSSGPHSIRICSLLTMISPALAWLGIHHSSRAVYLPPWRHPNFLATEARWAGSTGGIEEVADVTDTSRVADEVDVALLTWL